MNAIRQLVRLPYVTGLWSRFPIGSIATRVRYGIGPYPAYLYGVYAAAVNAVRLGIPRIAVIEFGVAGGRGLLALEQIASDVAAALGLQIQVLGFDTGAGLPPPTDYRDLPHVWGTGYYRMESEKLRAQLRHAELVLGDVGDTVGELMGRRAIAPVGFVAFDLDYYSSTVKAFRIFSGAPETRLPRVMSYFDDLVGPELACMNEDVGEYLAIREFNDSHPHMKIRQIANLRLARPRPEPWNDLMYAVHDYQHPLYTVNVMPAGDQHRQLPL